MFEEVAQALDDGEAEAAVAAAIGEPIEFAKNLAPVLLRDSRAGVPHFDAQGAAALPAADEHAARCRVTHRIRHEVGDDPSEQNRIAAYPSAAWRNSER